MILKYMLSEEYYRNRCDVLEKENRQLREEVSLDIFWLKDESLEDTENLPPPDVIAQEIADNLETALTSINELIVNLGKK